MIEKAAHILIVFLLVLATSGVSVYRHYSGNKLFSVSFFTKAKSCCEVPCPGCKDVSQHFQLKTDFLASDFSLDEVQTIDLLHFEIANDVSDQSFITRNRNFFFSNTSPPTNSVDLSDIQTFRI